MKAYTSSVALLCSITLGWHFQEVSGLLRRWDGARAEDQKQQRIARGAPPPSRSQGAVPVVPIAPVVATPSSFTAESVAAPKPLHAAPPPLPPPSRGAVPQAPPLDSIINVLKSRAATPPSSRLLLEPQRVVPLPMAQRSTPPKPGQHGGNHGGGSSKASSAPKPVQSGASAPLPPSSSQGRVPSATAAQPKPAPAASTFPPPPALPANLFVTVPPTTPLAQPTLAPQATGTLAPQATGIVPAGLLPANATAAAQNAPIAEPAVIVPAQQPPVAPQLPIAPVSPTPPAKQAARQLNSLTLKWGSDGGVLDISWDKPAVKK